MAMILCRPALPRDRDQVMGLLSEIWSGDDYVPEVWDRWLLGEPGLLAVAEVNGEILAQGHLAQLGYGEWWLEGLRVHPEAQGQGIGSRLHDYFVDRWLASAGAVVRLASRASLDSVHAMCRRTGFAAVSEFVPLTANPSAAGSAGGMKEVEAPDWTQIIMRLERSQLCRALAGLMDYDWRFARPLAERLGHDGRDRLLANERGDQHLLRIERSAERSQAQLLATSAPLPTLAGELGKICRWAAGAAVHEITWLAPDQSEFLLAAKEAGFEPTEEDRLIIFERRR